MKIRFVLYTSQYKPHRGVYLVKEDDLPFPSIPVEGTFVRLPAGVTGIIGNVYLELDGTVELRMSTTLHVDQLIEDFEAAGFVEQHTWHP